MLGAAAVVLAAVLRWSWLVAVDATPASQRPYVGGTTDNSELSLSFGHNGFGRVLGERGAPGHIVHAHRHATVRRAARASALGGEAGARAPLTGSISAAGPTGLLRLFDNALGDQGAWLLPFASSGCSRSLAGARRGAAGATRASRWRW